MTAQRTDDEKDRDEVDPGADDPATDVVVEVEVDDDEAKVKPDA